jgi:steroid delta-isomerase-like uncharacterized protein
MTTLQRLQAIAQRWIEEGWQKGNPGVVDELHAPGFVDRSSAGRAPGREGFKEGIAQLYAAFPDFYCEIQDLVVDEAAGKVAIRWAASGTHRGPFMGLEPTGRRIAFQGIEIIRIEDERIVERWGEWDGMALLENWQKNLSDGRPRRSVECEWL